MLKENLRSLKGIIDHKNKLLGELDDERLLIDKFSRNKDDLIKQRSNLISSIKSDEDAIKNTQKDLPEKQSSYEEIILEAKIACNVLPSPISSARIPLCLLANQLIPSFWKSNISSGKFKSVFARKIDDKSTLFTIIITFIK